MGYSKRDNCGVDIKKIRSIHTSYIVTLPKRLLNDIGIYENDNVIIFTKDDTLVIKKLELPELESSDIYYRVDSVEEIAPKPKSKHKYKSARIEISYKV